VTSPTMKVLCLDLSDDSSVTGAWYVNKHAARRHQQHSCFAEHRYLMVVTSVYVACTCGHACFFDFRRSPQIAIRSTSTGSCAEGQHVAMTVSPSELLKTCNVDSRAAGKLYTCGGYGEERASLLCIDTKTWQCSRPPTTGPAPQSHDSHSLAVHGVRRFVSRTMRMHRCTANFQLNMLLQ